MRIYETLTEAISEIKRDLSKSRSLSTNFVQGQIALNQSEYYELVGYSYMILSPISQQEAVDVAREIGYISSEEEEETYVQFLREENRNRKLAFFDSVLEEESKPDLYHKSLTKVQNLGYSYPERLFGGYQYLEKEIKRDRYSRRLFVPVFWPQDSQNVHGKVRIPCTIGYHFLIRRRLHYSDHALLIYYMRSNDLMRFWSSDLYFASELLMEFCKRTETEYSGVIHVVSSLHSWIGDEEIY